MKYRYIAIEGNIGAGKTSLASMLTKEFPASLLPETFAENIFLERFYKNPTQYAFLLEVSFLKDRFLQMRRHFAKEQQETTVSDYIFDKCLVFGEMNLNTEEFALFKDLHEILAQELPRPDIIIYLHNDPRQLLANIAKRGRPYELDIEEFYLEKIRNRYQQYFLTIQDHPVLWIDICGKDIVNDSTKYRKLRELINGNWKNGLQYVNI